MATRDQSRQGVIIARFLLDMMRSAARVVLSAHYGASLADEVMLCAAVYIGHHEGRPMSAAKLADYIGMPRPTVIRKLADLELRGLVKPDAARRWHIATDSPDVAAKVASVIDVLLPLIHKTATSLSRLDGGAIAPRESAGLEDTQGETGRPKKDKPR